MHIWCLKGNDSSLTATSVERREAVSRFGSQPSANCLAKETTNSPRQARRITIKRLPTANDHTIAAWLDDVKPQRFRMVVWKLPFLCVVRSWGQTFAGGSRSFDALGLTLWTDWGKAIVLVGCSPMLTQPISEKKTFCKEHSCHDFGLCTYFSPHLAVALTSSNLPLSIDLSIYICRCMYTYIYTYIHTYTFGKRCKTFMYAPRGQKHDLTNLYKINIDAWFC